MVRYQMVAVNQSKHIAFGLIDMDLWSLQTCEPVNLIEIAMAVTVYQSAEMGQRGERFLSFKPWSIAVCIRIFIVKNGFKIRRICLHPEQ